MNRLGKRIELVANVCIIVLALVISVALAKRFLLKSPGPAHVVSGIEIGTKINLPDVDWAKNDKTLVLVLSTGCKFCSASASFYQNLVAKSAYSSGTKLIAVFPQSVEQATEYLRSINVAIEDVKQASPASLGARATPTLILVNNFGLVTGSWVGQLSADKEVEVLARLQ
jgi:hypothetical protein